MKTKALKAGLGTAPVQGDGKTFVDCGLERALKDAGVDVGVIEPFASGALRRGKGWTHADVEALASAAGSRDPFEKVCPNLYRDPLAPLVAAEREGRRVDVAGAVEATRAMLARHAVTGAGGRGG